MHLFTRPPAAERPGAPDAPNGQSPPGSYGYGYPNSSIPDFARTWHLFLEKWWVLAASLVICVGLAFAYVSTRPVIYSATTTIQAEQTMPNILRLQPIQLGDLQAVDYLQTVAQSLTARPLLERVAQTNHLWNHPRFLSATNTPLTHNRVLARLEGMINVKLRRNTRLIDITVTDRDPRLCALVANAVVTEYLNAGAERQDSSIGAASKSLEKKAEELRKKLETSENALQAYKEKTKSSSMDDRENTVVAKLRELSTKATEAKSVRIGIETDYAQALSAGTNIDALLSTPPVARDPTVHTLILNLSRSENDFAVLTKRYKQKHPKYIEAATQIAELRGNITNAVLNAVQTLKASLEAAKSSEQALNEAMKAQEAAAIELSKISIQYNVLAREVDSDRALYDAVLKGMKEASVTKDTQQAGVIRVVDPAVPPDAPNSTRRTAILALGAIFGILFGSLIVLGLRAADTSIKTVDDAETVLGLSVCSVVPNVHHLKNGHTRLVVSEDARSEAAEAFRTLRTSLSTLGRSEAGRISLFTSAMPSEGKTFCSINYAASLAQLGHKTLLIDADLRRPSVEHLLRGQDTGAGLTDYLSGQRKLDEVVQPSRLENLFFVGGGSTAPNPAEMLARDGLGELIREAVQKYDYVVLDSAPINAVSDTLLMVRSVESVCLVVRAARTSSRYVLRCVQLLRAAEASLSGVVLNDMPRRRGPGYGAYYDYQHHGEYGNKGVYGHR